MELRLSGVPFYIYPTKMSSAGNIFYNRETSFYRVFLSIFLTELIRFKGEGDLTRCFGFEPS